MHQIAEFRDNACGSAVTQINDFLFQNQQVTVVNVTISSVYFDQSKGYYPVYILIYKTP